jgi:Domain of unknown function (DUF4352)
MNIVTRSKNEKIAIVGICCCLVIAGLGYLLSRRISLARSNNSSRLASIELSNKSVQPIELMAISWTLADPKTAMIPAPEGTQYIVVDVDLKNNTNVPIWITPVLQSYVTDQSEKNHGIELVITKNSFEAKSYNAGEVAKGELAYLVPKNDTIKWCFDFDTKRNDPICKVLDKTNFKEI